jgi:hypothetical protein
MSGLPGLGYNHSTAVKGEEKRVILLRLTRKAKAMASRKGQFFIFIVFILNAVAFIAVPWENFFFDKEKAIRENSAHFEEVDVKYLEPTGVYVVMGSHDEVVKGYDNPTWFHRKMSPYAQFYLYTGPVTEKMRTEISQRRKEYEGIPVLISELIDIPSSGKVSIDMTSTAYAQDYYVREAMKKLEKKYKLPGDEFYDSATPLCNALGNFKKASWSLLIRVVIIEVIVFTVLLVVLSIVAVSKKKKQAVKQKR